MIRSFGTDTALLNARLRLVACLAGQQVEDHHSNKHYQNDVGWLQRLRDSLRLRHGLCLLCLLRSPPGL